MMTTAVPIHAPPVLLTSPASSRSIHKLSTVTASWRMSMNSGSFQTKKREELSFHVHHPAAFDPKGDDTPKLLICALIACRLQLPEEELVNIIKMEFGQFVARGDLIDEEFWEFGAIRNRFIGPFGQQPKCIITLRKQGGMVKPTVLKSVVGTLDLIPVAGVKLMFFHVDRNNKHALQLFEKMGFEMIEQASDGLVEDNTYLLRCSL